MGIGICGILKPDGKFVKCKFGEHCKKLFKVPIQIREKCLWFSSPMNGNGSNSSVACENWDNGITQSQYNWVIKHKNCFDKGQLICLDIIFQGYVKII